MNGKEVGGEGTFGFTTMTVIHEPPLTSVCIKRERGLKIHSLSEILATFVISD